MYILGGGLAGLIAGVLNQDARILEPFANRTSHQALLRFRSPDIGDAVGIPFKKVTVYKGIWDEGHTALTPQYIAQYSRKVSSAITYRSIQHQETETRWIAPPDFQEQLKHMLAYRIEYDKQIESYHAYQSISTLPMNVLADIMGIDCPLDPVADQQVVKPIYVNRYRIPNCDVYMTVYFPSFKTSVYRASISGDVLIVESTREATEKEISEATEALGIHSLSLDEELINYEQKNGKLAPIDEKARRKWILDLTLHHGVYSLGRFATWRNIVLDDVYHDILKIKSFINKDAYEVYKEHHNES